MHALLEYALWYAHYTRDKLPEERDIDRLEPRVKELLNEKLDKKNDPSEAVHSVFGQFLANLHYLNKQWLRDSIPLIFSKDPRYWKAAWGTYISFSRVYTALYDLLRDQYLRAISLLPDERIFLDRSALSPEKGLAEHLMIAYLNDLDSLIDGSLVDLFFTKANDHQRASAINFLGELSSREKLFQKPEMWKKALDLWEIRITKVTTEKEKQGHEEEFTAFLSWAEGYVDPLYRLYKPIGSSLSLCKPQWRLDDLLRYIGKNADESAFEAVDLLDSLMQSVGQEGLSWHRTEVKEILAACVKSKKGEVRQRAVELINRFGEWGIYDYRELLERAKEMGVRE
jgi:hypothetical protein